MVHKILILLLAGQCALLFSGDRNPLHNTFYMEGEKVSYVLVMRADKTFDFYTPFGERSAGVFRTTEEYISFTADGVRRSFRYELKGNGDMEIKRRDDDVITKGTPVGQMPPVGNKALNWISEENWVKKKRPLFAPPALAISRPLPPETDPWPVRKIKVPPNPSAYDPRPTVASPVPTTDPPSPPIKPRLSAFEVRAINASPAPRFAPPPPPLPVQPQTVIAPPATPAAPETTTVPVRPLNLGAVRPKVEPPPPPGVPEVHAPAPVVPNKVLSPAPPVQPLEIPVSAPPPEKKSVAPEPPREPFLPKAIEKAELPAITNANSTTTSSEPALVADGQSISGVYIYKPNPFIAESLTLKDDGNFIYTDSNGVSVKGTARTEKDVLRLVSGDVEREFTVVLDGTRITLTRTVADTPRFANDLASMSPTVSKSASYEKK